MHHINGIGQPEITIILVILLLLAIIPARIARKKGYSFGGFYAFGVFFWLIALIVALCIKDKNAGNSQELLNYKKLLDEGAITQAEFDAKKEQLLK